MEGSVRHIKALHGSIRIDRIIELITVLLRYILYCGEASFLTAKRYLRLWEKTHLFLSCSSPYGRIYPQYD